LNHEFDSDFLCNEYITARAVDLANSLSFNSTNHDLSNLYSLLLDTIRDRGFDTELLCTVKTKIVDIFRGVLMNRINIQNGEAILKSDLFNDELFH
jgi:hypothetical protein